MSVNNPVIKSQTLIKARQLMKIDEAEFER
jgi:hypothetical protein